MRERERGREREDVVMYIIRVMTRVPVLGLNATRVSAEEKHSGEEYTREDQPPEHNTRGWRAVSAAGLQGKGLR